MTRLIDSKYFGYEADDVSDQLILTGLVACRQKKVEKIYSAINKRKLIASSVE